MTTTWRCPQCDFCYKTERVIYPVFCRCGHVDRGSPAPATTWQNLATLPPRFAGAILRWVQAGRPERSDAEVDVIYREACAPCEFRAGDRCRHPQCGCQVRSTAGESAARRWLHLPGPLLNKLRLATESCPLGKWGPAPAAGSSTADRPPDPAAG